MSSIAAGTTLTTALVSTGDTTGELVLKTNGTTTAVTIDTSQNVAVVGQIVAAAGTVSLPSITTTGDVNTGIFFSAADTLVVTTGGTAAVTVDAGQRTKFPTTIGVGGATPSASGSGISFPATQSASSDANTLDDYEEGTWTPVYTGSGGSIGSTAYVTRAGTYTKIGNVVTVGLQLLLSNKGSWTGTVVITGLPFTAANDGIQSIGGLQVNNVTFADQINLRVGPNEATIVPRINTSGAGGDFLQTTAVVNTSAFYGIVVYRV
jgi:hypothetical protein